MDMCKLGGAHLFDSLMLAHLFNVFLFLRIVVGPTNSLVRLLNLSVRLILFVCYDMFGYFCNVLKVENLNLM